MPLNFYGKEIHRHSSSTCQFRSCNRISSDRNEPSSQKVCNLLQKPRKDNQQQDDRVDQKTEGRRSHLGTYRYFQNRTSIINSSSRSYQILKFTHIISQKNKHNIHSFIYYYFLVTFYIPLRSIQNSAPLSSSHDDSIPTTLLSTSYPTEHLNIRQPERGRKNQVTDGKFKSEATLSVDKMLKYFNLEYKILAILDENTPG